MPSVSGPSDGGYNYYPKQISDTEEELKAEARKKRANEEKQIDELERKFQANLRKRDTELARTVQEIKKNADRSLSSERENWKNEVDRIKSQTYDKWGRYNGLEGDVLNEQMNDVLRSSEVQHQADKRNLDESKEMYEQRIRDLNEKHREELERSIGAERTSANETFHKAYSEGRDAYKDEKQKLQQEFSERNREMTEQQHLYRRNAEKAIESAEGDYKHKLAKAQQADDYRFHRQQRSLADSSEDSTRELKSSHAEETRKLRSEIKNLIEAETHYVKGKDEGYSDAIKEYESEWRGREKLITEGYEKTIKKMKGQEKESDRYNTFINKQALREKDSYFADVISKQNVENRERQKDIEKTFSGTHEQMSRAMKRDQEASRDLVQNTLAAANKQKDDALAHQAKSYQETIARMRASDRDQLNALQRDLVAKTTSESTLDVSPAAEQKIRMSAIGGYEKAIQAETDRNRKTVEDMQTSYAQKIRDVIRDTGGRKSIFEGQSVIEHNQERSDLLNHIQDLEVQRQQSIRDQESDHGREKENLNRNWTTMLDRQRSGYEDLFRMYQNDAIARLGAQRQEAEFNSKKAQRAFVSRENELIREYNKRLADQKSELTAEIDEIKAQASTAVREADRRTKQVVEEQARSYEQRIDQLQLQQKERERYLMQNHQEELEKVKRSHAQLLQKKS